MNKPTFNFHPMNDNQKPIRTQSQLASPTKSIPSMIPVPDNEDRHFPVIPTNDYYGSYQYTPNTMMNPQMRYDHIKTPDSIWWNVESSIDDNCHGSYVRDMFSLRIIDTLNNLLIGYINNLAYYTNIVLTDYISTGKIDDIIPLNAVYSLIIDQLSKMLLDSRIKFDILGNIRLDIVHTVNSSKEQQYQGCLEIGNIFAIRVLTMSKSILFQILSTYVRDIVPDNINYNCCTSKLIEIVDISTRQVICDFRDSVLDTIMALIATYETFYEPALKNSDNNLPEF